MPLTFEQILPAIRSLLARELVHHRGFTRREAATLLALTPAAVTLYLRGKRGEAAGRRLSESPEMAAIVPQLVDELVARQRTGQVADPPTLILDAAHKLLTLRRRAPGRPSSPPRAPSRRSPRPEAREWISILRERLAAEQAAARRSMELALRTQNDLSKALFRQIASDSLRHADIVATLITYLEKGGDAGRHGDTPDARELEAMLRDEESAEEAELEPLRRLKDANVRLLVDSIEADERKHTLLLRGFLQAAKRRRGAAT